MGSSPALAPAPPAKNVVVYRNGDPFFRGRRVVVNQRRFLTFEAFLNELTRSVGAAVAVRKLYTARQGRRVARLGDLRDGCQYVAAGSERFKSLEVRTRDPGRTRRCQEPPRPLCRHTALPHPLRRLSRSVFRNGDLLSPPFRLPLPGSALPEQDALLTLLTEKVTVRGGAVRKLCRLDGAQVCEAEELVNGGYYVAVGAEKYQNLPYLELLVPQAPVYRTPRCVGSSCGCWLAPSTGLWHLGEVPLGSVYLQYPFSSLLSLAGGVVYKAKDPRRETRGAREVKEDEHTKVEVPIDQVGDTISCPLRSLPLLHGGSYSIGAPGFAQQGHRLQDTGS
uniref:Doublecortin domain containing 2B n=1 Tax=Nothoprocta perdicaria TaxID=30464 RepID=A0A8C7EBA3_NOTPE